ncbi:S-formylglutathione hydrolase FrmB [Mycobacterium frederiksbergense]|uniref:S-formylglutathione hydrolase FrmB n=1 Tax=Mycolicibacterium frederiksbergense TaxID=117567 RepID=A0ABT6L2H1_9MYCO|nr:alpha/beta hydrolase-fold protein [Mycolicibacterium frederiksbergense]MDH6197151.1 S-formylglutathione hydrolase FrmB [Mycolicibacterium frederiksbergense]
MHQLIAQISLIHGWFPVVVQLVAALLLGAAVGWRSRQWRRRSVPALVVAAAVLAAATYWYIDSIGLAGNAGPLALWVWVGLTALAVGVALLGWVSAHWWRRTASVAAVGICVLVCALTVNIWVGYFPNVHAMWNQLTAGPLPGQTDRLTVTKMQLTHTRPANGVLVPVTIDSEASGFDHRGELVYLPPAWFSSNPPPRLPAVMMIGSQLNTPADWLRAGSILGIIDGFAAGHGGNAPVLVFVDATGSFANDTECVNGVRGNAADHLTKDVVPYMISNFGVRSDRDGWGIVGWSMGGTCAVDLTLMHPDMFRSFVDIAGDLRPNAGDKGQTISRLFGGDADAWAEYDPITIMRRHGPYDDVTAWFEVPTAQNGGTTHDPIANPEGQDVAATTLCDAARADAITCSVQTAPGRHDWAFATNAFATALPWLAGQLHTPGVDETALPPSTLGQATIAQTAPR